jgi:hypothetical protein
MDLDLRDTQLLELAQELRIGREQPAGQVGWGGDIAQQNSQACELGKGLNSVTFSASATKQHGRAE